ncbi:p13 [Leucania separata nucleopolyhedrovirus]|uniref:p13 n=1 Tax=Leucania separata nucleopolyhedrovirus TaxID=1307956 RepID=Q0IL05_NPVLS|nr:p13 [Leucania separata nucleopolyhedrovirus]AAR28878.1 p13 [Leucania separata nucleopolyhedrovirus]
MFAFVTLVMLGDKYVAGALALAKSLLATNTRHRLVCMVTPDVSAAAVARLKMYYYVHVVDYVRYKCPRMMTKRQDQLYGAWIDYAFTKWQCLRLTAFEKIVYLDADHLVVKNIDHLFDLEAPALCFHSEFHSYYDRLSHGDRVSPDQIDGFLARNKVLGKTGTMLLKPSPALYSTVRKLLNANNDCLKQCRYHNGFDEQVFFQALVQNGIGATQLSFVYVWNAGAYNKLRKNIEPFVINYYGDKKPWDVLEENAPYMDIYIWRYFKMLADLDVQLPSPRRYATAAY